MGEMFLNFPLDPMIQPFATIDVGLLELPSDECKHWWMEWNRTLMGFRALLYNSIKMYLVAKEMI
jgi:hypothetical protein